MVDRMGKQTLGAAGQRTLRRIHRKWQLYLLILPAIVSVFIFHYIPIYGVQIAFKNFRSSKGILGSEWVGFKHFARFLAYPDFWKILWNTVRISLYALDTFPCPVILALMMNELNSERYKKFMQMVTFAPHFISTVVVCSMVLLFFDRSQGLVNNVIAALGGERYDFVSSTRYFSSLYVWSGVWQNLGWNAIIYIAALSSVSPELIEAAVYGLHIVFAVFPIVGFQMVATNFFLSIGMSKKAIFLSLTRQMLFLVPCLLILPRWFGTLGVWISIPIADTTATIVTALVLINQFRKFHSK